MAFDQSQKGEKIGIAAAGRTLFATFAAFTALTSFTPLGELKSRCSLAAFQAQQT
jgi:hypothetical protein